MSGSDKQKKYLHRFIFSGCCGNNTKCKLHAAKLHKTQRSSVAVVCYGWRQQNLWQNHSISLSISALLTQAFQDHVMVFTQTKKQAHRMHILLGLMGLKVGELHRNLSQTQKTEEPQQIQTNIEKQPSV
ncbi:unnamed protein product [Oncorhynchus mykiss]|uniref:Uncharacterized protein n=1 Tax=Oncorhynchus mykiss TaxID=8022 RepID=A0A060W8D8_ONCMY|nr:unnamed protein product [Oncorhynchus mykiss]